MDPTMHLIARSVQRTVMSAPTTSVSEAVEAARRAARGVGASLDGVQRALAGRRPASSVA